MLRRLVAIAPLVLLLSPSKAWAGGGGVESNLFGTLGGKRLEVQGKVPGDAAESGRNEGSGGGSTTSCYYGSVKVPCTDSAGTAWSSHWNGYCKQVEVSADHPVWVGHEGQGGAAYMCTRPNLNGGDPELGAGGQGEFGPVWLASPPALPPPDPAEMAANLLATLDFEPVEMGPGVGGWLEDDPQAMGAVGLPNWLWVQDPTPTTAGPQTASASERGYNVTLTAKLSEVEWDLGDGSPPIKCGLGKAFDPRTMDASTPVVCGRQQGYRKEGVYTVTATAHWRAEWSGIGETGAITFDLVATHTTRIGEIQVVTDR